MKNTRATKGILLGCGLLALAACSKNSGSGTGSVQSATTLASTTQAQIKVGMKIYDGGTLIYDDASSTSMLALKANKTYNVVLNPSSAVSGLSYSVALTKTSAVGSSAQMSTMQNGNNNFMVSSQGDYAIKVVASAPKMLALTKSYTAAVSCATPTFTASSLNASAISASAAGANNLFNISASGIASGANGQAPYLCAFDPTGTGIIDTGFVDCNSGVSKFYNNYVANRKVSVIVKDACNTIYTVSNNVSMAYSVPATGAGNVFIYGQVSNASGSAVGDSRVDAVTYLATNQNPGHNIVQPAYNGSTFTITASQNYGMASSIPFGMNIAIQGISGSVDVASGSGSLSMAGASIKSLSYSTDHAGDAKTAVTFNNGSCILTDPGVKVLFQAGTPCTDGSASGRQATVEVWGTYVCTNVKNSAGAVKISGQFDGLTTLVDSCSGGGGGGGGIVPINL